MSYAPRRPKVSKKDRIFVFERAGGRCYLCGEVIVGPYQIDHELARELGGSDDVSNLRPAHPDCHRAKSKADVKLIAKSNRIRRANGPVEQRKRKTPIRTRGFPKGGPKRAIASRPFK